MATAYNPYTVPDMPKYPAAPTYVPTGIDTSRINFLTQQAAAPGLRGLRRGLQDTIGRRYDNPNAQAMVAERALTGFGQGLADVMGSAQRTGLSLYNPEFNAQDKANQLTYSGEMNKLKADYEAKLKDYYNRYATRDSLYQKGLTGTGGGGGRLTTADYQAARARLETMGNVPETGGFSWVDSFNPANRQRPAQDLLNSYPQY